MLGDICGSEPVVRLFGEPAAAVGVVAPRGTGRRGWRRPVRTRVTGRPLDGSGMLRLLLGTAPRCATTAAVATMAAAAAAAAQVAGEVRDRTANHAAAPAPASGPVFGAAGGRGG